jgi:hypothetical protein
MVKSFIGMGEAGWSKSFASQRTPQLSYVNRGLLYSTFEARLIRLSPVLLHLATGALANNAT